MTGNAKNYWLEIFGTIGLNMIKVPNVFKLLTGESVYKTLRASKIYSTMASPSLDLAIISVIEYFNFFIKGLAGP